MNNIELLVIRACKSECPDKRLVSVYRRFYGKYDEKTTTEGINHILVTLVDRYKLMDIYDIIKEMSPDNSWKYQSNDTYLGVANQILLSSIRLSSINVFPGFVSPKRFKE